MGKTKFKLGQKVSVNSAFSPSLLGRIIKEPKYIEKSEEFEYLVQTEQHAALGKLGDMCFLESELSAIEDQITKPS